MPTLGQLIEMAAKSSLTGEIVSEYCRESKITLDEFLSSFSVSVARGFANGSLGFEFCDAAVNELPGLTRYELPPVAWSVYDAFDAGEYRRSGDAQHEDPVDKYTRPAIAQILNLLDAQTAPNGT